MNNATKLTYAARCVLVEGRRVGLAYSLCCAKACVSVPVFYLWLSQGKKDRESGKLPWPVVDGDYVRATEKGTSNAKWSKSLELLEAMDRAETERVSEALTWVRAAANGGDWKAAAWISEKSKRQQQGDATSPFAAVVGLCLEQRKDDDTEPSGVPPCRN